MDATTMTRSSPAWLLIGFLIAFVAVGFAHWQLPYNQVSLPDSLYGPGLVAVGVIALMLRAFGTGRFLTAWLLIATTVPAAVMARVLVETSRDPTSHNLWPLEILIALAVGLVCSLIGTAIGSLLLMRSSKRPG
jgi:hypothetical protein